MGRPRTPWLIGFAEARALYESGQSVDKVATACGVAATTVTRKFREMGVVFRGNGPIPGTGPAAPTRQCKRDECFNEFYAWPSQNKVYCSPRCRYSDPRLAERIRSNIDQRHVLSEVDPVALRAVCANCGSVDIRRRTEKRLHATTATYRCRQAERARVWAREYGVTVEWVEQRLAEQKGRCAICDGDNDGKPLRVDHCHVAIQGRGMLCDPCNRGLGIFGDDPVRLRAAATYLETFGAASLRSSGHTPR